MKDNDQGLGTSSTGATNTLSEEAARSTVSHRKKTKNKRSTVFLIFPFVGKDSRNGHAARDQSLKSNEKIKS